MSGRPLTSGGKPEVFYVASEFCPYCTGESWPLIAALSRFGQFSGLRTSRSPHFDDVPPIDGWTFYGSSYTSRYLAFAPVETYSNVLVKPTDDPGSAKSYRKLQPLTAAEQAVLGASTTKRGRPRSSISAAPPSSSARASTPPSLVGLTWSQIAADLRRPTSTAGATLFFTAGALTAELCQLTGRPPGRRLPDTRACARETRDRRRPRRGRIGFGPERGGR